MHHDPGFFSRLFLVCTWNPTPGKLYQNFYWPGYVFSDKPAYPSPPFRPGVGTLRFVGESERIPHSAIFMYLGGVGGKQRCPGNYVAFRVLYGEKAGWLIYPEQYNNLTDEYPPINPIRL